MQRHFAAAVENRQHDEKLLTPLFSARLDQPVLRLEPEHGNRHGEAAGA
jgi:hypothetical protein